MKLNEKLMKYRKENALTRQELAEKLYIPKQTVSNWEFGQATPDEENITKIATLFKTSVNDLLDENINPFEEKIETKNRKSSLKSLFIVIFLFCVFLGIGAILLNKEFNSSLRQEDKISVIEMFKDHSIEEIIKIVSYKPRKLTNYDISAFNSTFEVLYTGEKRKFFMNSFINRIIESNGKNPTHLITVKYGEFESNDADELRDLKIEIELGDIEKFNIYYEYGANGLINKAVVEAAQQTDSFEYEIF